MARRMMEGENGLFAGRQDGQIDGKSETVFRQEKRNNKY